MIRLSDAARARFARLANPPTHATIVHQRNTLLPPGTVPHDTIRTFARDNEIFAVYVFGSLDHSGAFVCDAEIVPAKVLVDLVDHTADPPPLPGSAQHGIDFHAEQLRRTAAAINLLGAGVAPTPGSPHVAKKTAGKPAGEYRDVDLDAIFAHFNAELAGDVVTPPANIASG